MWKISSKTWGNLEAGEAYSSTSFKGMITVRDVTRDGKELWVTAYLPVSEIKVIVPPKEFS